MFGAFFKAHKDAHKPLEETLLELQAYGPAMAVEGRMAQVDTWHKHTDVADLASALHEIHGLTANDLARCISENSLFIAEEIANAVKGLHKGLSQEQIESIEELTRANRRKGRKTFQNQKTADELDTRQGVHRHINSDKPREHTPTPPSPGTSHNWPTHDPLPKYPSEDKNWRLKMLTRSDTRIAIRNKDYNYLGLKRDHHQPVWGSSSSKGSYESFSLEFHDDGKVGIKNRDGHYLGFKANNDPQVWASDQMDNYEKFELVSQRGFSYAIKNKDDQYLGFKANHDPELWVSDRIGGYEKFDIW